MRAVPVHPGALNYRSCWLRGPAAQPEEETCTLAHGEHCAGLCKERERAGRTLMPASFSPAELPLPYRAAFYWIIKPAFAELLPAASAEQSNSLFPSSSEVSLWHWPLPNPKVQNPFLGEVAHMWILWWGKWWEKCTLASFFPYKDWNQTSFTWKEKFGKFNKLRFHDRKINSWLREEKRVWRDLIGKN